jgi:hypothetical protein
MQICSNFPWLALYPHLFCLPLDERCVQIEGGLKPVTEAFKKTKVAKHHRISPSSLSGVSAVSREGLDLEALGL